ncbi:MAG: hypothetical protein FJY67_00990 [Calditrichaeota bacterium]|nr:hypothetical protein [Calditrichota bacterium]
MDGLTPAPVIIHPPLVTHQTPRQREERRRSAPDNTPEAEEDEEADSDGEPDTSLSLDASPSGNQSLGKHVDIQI